jgi:hypothetical protein
MALRLAVRGEARGNDAVLDVSANLSNWPNQRKTGRKIKGFGQDTVCRKRRILLLHVDERTFLMPDVIALRPFVPAEDFETSLRFFADLGFRAYRLGDLLASTSDPSLSFCREGQMTTSALLPIS